VEHFAGLSGIRVACVEKCMRMKKNDENDELDMCAAVDLQCGSFSGSKGYLDGVQPTRYSTLDPHISRNLVFHSDQRKNRVEPMYQLK
jgi:hypothetical protein